MFSVYLMAFILFCSLFFHGLFSILHTFFSHSVISNMIETILNAKKSPPRKGTGKGLTIKQSIAVFGGPFENLQPFRKFVLIPFGVVSQLYSFKYFIYFVALFGGKLAIAVRMVNKGRNSWIFFAELFKFFPLFFGKLF